MRSVLIPTLKHTHTYIICILHVWHIDVQHLLWYINKIIETFICNKNTGIKLFL